MATTKFDITAKVKASLRISTSDTNINTEISDCVDECIEDLTRSGASVDLDDPLILKACKLYAKAFFGYENDSEKYRSCYEEVQRQLGMYSAHSTGE